MGTTIIPCQSLPDQALSTPLAVPDVHGLDTLAAALAYARAGWYLLPVRRGQKDPGSVVGKGWPSKSSRDPQVIAAWFAGTDHGIALHVGRSGALAFDVDDPTKVPDVLAAAVEEHAPPRQATREPDTGRGHVLFRLPDGFMAGNAQRLGAAFGDVRGRNGVIIVEPSLHQRHAEGGAYRWTRTGGLPLLPPSLVQVLRPTGPEEVADAATDAEVGAFMAAHASGNHLRLARAAVREFDDEVARGASRHMSALHPAAWIAREARAGLYPAADALAMLRERFVEAATHDAPSGLTRTTSEARAAYPGLFGPAWSPQQRQEGAGWHLRDLAQRGAAFGLR